MRKKLIVAVTFLGGLFFFLEFMLPKGLGGESLSKLESPALRIVQIIGAMAIGLGVINIIRVHGAKIAQRKKGMVNSIALIVAMVVMVWVTLQNHLRKRVMEPLKRSAAYSAYYVERLAEAAPHRVRVERESLPADVQTKEGVFKVEGTEEKGRFVIFCSPEAAEALAEELGTPVEVVPPSPDEMERKRELAVGSVESTERVLASTRRSLERLLPPPVSLPERARWTASRVSAILAEAEEDAEGRAGLAKKVVKRALAGLPVNRPYARSLEGRDEPYEKALLGLSDAIDDFASGKGEPLDGALKALEDASAPLQGAALLPGIEGRLSALREKLASGDPAVLFQAAAAARGVQETVRADARGVRAALERTHLSMFESEIIFNGLFGALASAMFSLLAFYMATAAYRAFRVQTGETALLMASAVLVMLGQVPLGLYMWDQLPLLRGWVLSNVNVGGFRAISIGAGIAGFAMAIRMWLSLDRQTMGGGGR